MSGNLVIVESPAKAKTISKYLGRGYRVLASVGHVRDLPPKELGVDIANGFAPTYQVSKGKGEVIRKLKEAVGESDLVYLAMDPDREGEAIAWHVGEVTGLTEGKTRRIAFYQVTKRAVQEALKNPRGLDRDLIDAQQSRRVLDRLVGYKISPILSRTMRKPLSAGRVQSVALRLVVEREREIEAFVPEEYWTLEAELQRRTQKKERFKAHLLRIKGEKPHLGSKEEMDEILPVLSKATYTVTKVKKGQRRRNPYAPFITSTLQTEASHRLHFSPQRTMRLAQQLYEGIELGEGADAETVGLITYMRTDSPHVAPEAQEEARRYISKRWGEEYLPSSPPAYRSTSSSAQEAHEAIRPTSVFRTPKTVRKHLNRSQARLYELIWRRFLASQMQPALYATMSVDIVAAKDYLFRATGRRLIFPGFLAVYKEGKSEKDSQFLPPLEKGEVVDLHKLLPEQHFTQPPPRYSESTLIKALKGKGVGRPSTYASIISVIQRRRYVTKEDGRLKPTDLGITVCDALVAAFSNIMEVEYTARMEEQLDHVAEGKVGYEAMLSAFYGDLEPKLGAAPDIMDEAIQRSLKANLPESLRNRNCPLCGKPLVVRVSKMGRFLGCTGYPECRYTLDISDPENPQETEDEFVEGERCPKCGGRMKIVHYGNRTFLGCENYPKCKYTRPILSERIKNLAAETACPKCGRKPMEPRKGRYGEYLYCPDCEENFSLRKLGLDKVEKVDIPCPKCGHSPLEKRTGRYGPYYHCPACKANTSEKEMARIRGE
ncbi:MAG: type I DNA topoisomerase [Chloroflexota bacterium]|nr:type I DNA topoisomerase [Chloroflexota bacterium]